MKNKFKYYFSGKVRQLKHLSWFFAGFFLCFFSELVIYCGSCTCYPARFPVVYAFRRKKDGRRVKPTRPRLLTFSF